MPITPKVIFILKRREDYNTNIPNFTSKQVATGMYNSALFVSEMLNANGIQSSVELAHDANSIDAIVHGTGATHVFIEGYWVVPSKFDELMPLHPNVKWIVRCHSELPFLAQEGIAMSWTFDYMAKGVLIAGNSPRIAREIQLLAKAVKAADPMPMLPNYYPINLDVSTDIDRNEDGAFHVGCFGAIRPMKNQLSQAIAAYEFCRKNNMMLKFHINAGRVEMNGANTLKNLHGLFDNLPGAELIEHSWTDHEGFLALLGSMDLLMQVSFTETFNIVAADAVSQGVPVVASSEISWLQGPFADPTSTESMVNVMEYVWKKRKSLVHQNKIRLFKYSQRAVKVWVNFLTKDLITQELKRLSIIH
jgi:hypothetical protein